MFRLKIFDKKFIIVLLLKNLGNHMGQKFFSAITYSANFVVNQLPVPILDNYLPFEELFHKGLDYSFPRVFGCECFPTILRPCFFRS